MKKPIRLEPLSKQFKIMNYKPIHAYGTNY